MYDVSISYSLPITLLKCCGCSLSDPRQSWRCCSSLLLRIRKLFRASNLPSVEETGSDRACFKLVDAGYRAHALARNALGCSLASRGTGCSWRAHRCLVQGARSPLACVPSPMTCSPAVWHSRSWTAASLEDSGLQAPSQQLCGHAAARPPHGGRDPPRCVSHGRWCRVGCQAPSAPSHFPLCCPPCWVPGCVWGSSPFWWLSVFLCKIDLNLQSFFPPSSAFTDRILRVSVVLCLSFSSALLWLMFLVYLC